MRMIARSRLRREKTERTAPGSRAKCFRAFSINRFINDTIVQYDGLGWSLTEQVRPFRWILLSLDESHG